MDFKKQKPIYQQIADTLCERIVGGQWKGDDRIPSVRDVAIQLGVNPNTVMRSFDHLQQAEIIYNRRNCSAKNSSTRSCLLSCRDSACWE